ncbi:hypothetical protein F4808DRAFT_267965 [Astrocystis sublimbata]|nr:hypothetical protein F4808DRAFT_267965 [Astrocystis sublimbata]
MPTIYSSLYTNFIRQGFAKTLTHGYAQSVVAATHPHVLNNQNRPTFARRASQRVGRLSSLQLQNAFHTANANAQNEHRLDRLANNGNLDAYFEALKTKEEAGEVEKEWTQFQFPKPIEWKPDAEAILEGSEPALRSPHTGLVEGVQLAPSSQDAPVPVDVEEALAHIDAAIVKEIEVRELREALEESTTNSLRATSPTVESVIQSRAATPALERTATPASSVTRSITPPVDSQSQSYADHLTKLSEDGRYAEIPAVFEAMLVADIKPIATAYNALLVAAIRIPSEKYEVVPKALDVYADMLRRNVTPNADTYNVLVGLLAARCLEVNSLTKSLEGKRVRYGGMDEPGKFMFASTELEHAIVSEDDRLDLALKLFKSSVTTHRANYSSETYHQLISACAEAGRVSDMLQLFEHMEMTGTVPFASTFPSMITAFAKIGDLASAVECYNEYKDLAVAHDGGKYTLNDRLDSEVYASVINAYVMNNRLEGAMKFYEKLDGTNGSHLENNGASVKKGFVKGLISTGAYHEALQWAEIIPDLASHESLGAIATAAADAGDRQTAVTAFAKLPGAYSQIVTSAMALLAMCVRQGDISGATTYWQFLTSSYSDVDASYIEPTAMYAVAMIGSGQVAEGLTESERMFHRIRTMGKDSSMKADLAQEVDEGEEFISSYISARGITDPRLEPAAATLVATQPIFAPSPHPSISVPVPFEDNIDPYAHNTDFKGSSIISDELEGAHGRKGPRLQEALNRFRNMRRAGRHPRYITYSKLISAAARESKMGLCNEILSMARTDVPFVPQYPIVRYGWSSILDAMVGACLTLGDRRLAEQYHIELLNMGAAPSANTFGLYITTLKESTKTFDEASEAVKIFLRAKAEGVEPSSFLYNALIGKLGKARRIDDCLFYFAEMRALGIKPTSVTYGTIVNALCRVSDEKFAEELFDEMEAMPNYKARPAPYNSMMQFFLTTKRDKSKVLGYYERMKTKGIAPTAHTFKLLVDTHATLEPVDMPAAEAVLDMIRSSGGRPEPVHYASLIHARGCVLHDLEGARKIFDSVMSNPSIPANACLFQALFEAMVANHHVADTEPVLAQMKKHRVELTPYIANTLIHGWASEKNITKAASIYNGVSFEKREPSTYEAMTRAYLAVEERDQAQAIVSEMLSRGYPSAVVNKILELLGGGAQEVSSATS